MIAPTSALLMLDTNTVSHIVKGHERALARLAKTPMTEVCISTITEGEVRFGLAKRPQATRLHHIVHEFLQRVEIKPWDSTTAIAYGTLRAALESTGKTVGALDLLIAAHAIALDCRLITNDSGFEKIGHLKTEDWTA
jgi:tRNA(fMet)-specific endonuclease VapC